MSVAFGIIIAISSAFVCAVLIVILRPVLRSYAIAEPNIRSSHKIPTPQGGGIAVVAATIAVSSVALHFLPADTTAALRLPIIGAAAVLMAGVGVLADLHSENVGARLLLQTLAVAGVIFALPAALRVFPILPLAVERVGLVIGVLWFVNLVNFMDGLDWMTVVETVPLTAALAVMGFLGLLPPAAVVVSLTLCGSMLGFAYFNRPVARLFLGDVGSLPIGLVAGWLLVLLFGNGGRAAAILLPLYYIADTTITLVRRAFNGEKIWRAHRTHFYQRATDGGLSVNRVITQVSGVNLVLAALAVTTAIYRDRSIDAAAIAGGGALVLGLLFSFARGTK